MSVTAVGRDWSMFVILALSRDLKVSFLACGLHCVGSRGSMPRSYCSWLLVLGHFCFSFS